MFWLLLTVAFAHMNTKDLFRPVHKMTKHFSNHVSHSRRNLDSMPFATINCADDDEQGQTSWTSATCDGSHMYMAMSSTKTKCQNGDWDMRASIKMGLCTDFGGDTYGKLTCDSSSMTMTVDSSCTSANSETMDGHFGTIAMKPDQVDDWKCNTEADDKTGYYSQISCSGENVVVSQYPASGCASGTEISTGAITTNCMKMESTDDDIECPVSGGNKDASGPSSNDEEEAMQMAMSMKCQDGYVMAKFCKKDVYAINLSNNPLNAAEYFTFKKDECMKEDMSDCKESVASQQPAFKFGKGTGDLCTYDKFSGEASNTCAAEKKNTDESFEVTGGATCTNVQTIDGHKVVFSVDCSGDMVRIEPCELKDADGNQINLDQAAEVVVENNAVVVKSSDGSTVSSTTVKIADSTASADSFKDESADPVNGGASSSAALMAFIAVFAAMFNL